MLWRPAAILNRKKVAIRTDFLFLAPLRQLIDGSEDGAARPLAKLQVPALAFGSCSDPGLVR